jgi:diacylglycerol kinase family enzyme
VTRGQTIEVIVNTQSGGVSSGETIDQLEELFKEYGLAAKIHRAQTGDAVERLAASSAAGEADVVVAGGGDGTVSTVASALVNTDKAIAVLPLGTLNNFSKDLRIPQDLDGAVRLIASGHTLLVDAAEVNGKYFINNSSIGLYPRIVRSRERQQRLGRGKWWAAAWAAWRFLWVTPLFRVKLHFDHSEFVRKTPFVFVGNNDYEMDLYNIGRRLRMDEGLLSVYLVHGSGRIGLIDLVLRTVCGRLKQASDFEELRTDGFTVVTRKKRVLVARDGEVSLLTSPLKYKIHPKSLKVIAPRPE